MISIASPSARVTDCGRMPAEKTTFSSPGQRETQMARFFMLESVPGERLYRNSAFTSEKSFVFWSFL